MTDKTFHIKEPVYHAFHRIKDQLRKGSINDVCEYFIENFDKIRESSAKPTLTKDEDLAEKYPCATRFSHEGFFYCHRGKGFVKKLLTIKACQHCKDRLDEQAFLNLQQELTKQKLHAMQLSLNSTIQKHKDQLYPTCDPLERQGEYGYEIRSDKCPNERIKDEWHPPDVCPLNCPFLKRVQIKKKVKQT